VVGLPRPNFIYSHAFSFFLFLPFFFPLAVRKFMAAAVVRTFTIYGLIRSPAFGLALHCIPISSTATTHRTDIGERRRLAHLTSQQDEDLGCICQRM
jgi:hypothetical protein